MTHTILLVEDEDIIRTTLKEFLIGEGFLVTDASSVEAALQLVRKQDFEVAVCDVQLPDGDGVQLLKKMRQINSEMFGLIITAYATVENAVEAFKAGAFDFLIKPVIFEDLANKLRRMFEYRGLYLENIQLRRELTVHED
ncbi:MAG TPA: response regulator, partial [Planctomycetaceae bacterium]|nr:response regulator [Planctomycetaceae bacterium]